MPNGKRQTGAFAVPLGDSKQGYGYDIRRRDYSIPGVLRTTDIELPNNSKGRGISPSSSVIKNGIKKRKKKVE